jgi:glycosyltransferase involved in cell wall biosynthesis
MKVAYVVGTLGRGGAEKQLVLQARALVERGVRLSVFSLTNGEPHEQDVRHVGVEPVWLGRHRSRLGTLVSLFSRLRREAPDIVHSTHFYTNLYAGVAGAALKIPTVGSIRNDARLEMKANGVWGPALLRATSIIVANSEAGRRNAIRRGLRADRITVVPNVIDLAEFDQRAGSPFVGELPAGVIALLVGRLVPAKRIDRFIEALALARRTAPDLCGVIAGDGPLRPALEQQAASLGIRPPGLTFLGARTDVPALMRRAAMLVLTSEHEGFPNVLLEAMAAGLPVVTVDAGDAIRVVGHEIAGLVARPAEPEAIAKLMVQLAGDADMARKLGSAGRARVTAEYSYAHLAPRLEELYRGLIR